MPGIGHLHWKSLPMEIVFELPGGLKVQLVQKVVVFPAAMVVVCFAAVFVQTQEPVDTAMLLKEAAGSVHPQVVMGPPGIWDLPVASGGHTKARFWR